MSAMNPVIVSKWKDASCIKADDECISKDVDKGEWSPLLLKVEGLSTVRTGIYNPKIEKFQVDPDHCIGQWKVTHYMPMVPVPGKEDRDSMTVTWDIEDVRRAINDDLTDDQCREILCRMETEGEPENNASFNDSASAVWASMEDDKDRPMSRASTEGVIWSNIERKAKKEGKAIIKDFPIVGAVPEASKADVEVESANIRGIVLKVVSGGLSIDRSWESLTDEQIEALEASLK